MRSYVFLACYMALLPATLMQPFVGALVWCWIAFMNPHREVWGFATNLPYAMTIFLVTIFACVVAREPKRLELNAVTVLLIVLAVLMTISSFMTIGPPSETWRIWERTMKTIVGTLLVASLLTTRERIHALVWLMAISMSFYGVKGGIFTLNTGGSFIVLGPPDSMVSDRNHLAVALLIAIPLMNYLRMQSAHALVRFGLLAAMALTLVAAVGSQSRGALVALAATSLVLWLRGKNKVISGFLIAACVAGTVNFMPQGWTDRMNTIANYEADASAMGRVRIWEASWLLAVSRPLTGTGFRAPYYQEVVNQVAPNVTARAVHSIYFEILAEHGFPAFVVWLSMTLAAAFYAWRLVRLTRRRPDLAWAGDLGRMVQVSIVAYLTGGAFLSLSYWDYYWTILITTAAAHAIVVRTLQQEAAGVRPIAAERVAGGWRRPAPALARAP